MLKKRIIPCLDVLNGRVVKGVQFRNHIDMGDIVELALYYAEQGADELVFYDISASPDGRSVSSEWVSRVSERIDIPFCVAGGIDSVDKARTILHAGADKISINTPALNRPELINELADAFGSQCVVIGMDSISHSEIAQSWQLRTYTGNPDKMQNTTRYTLDWVQEVQDRGAGEIVLNCMSADGVKQGYDLIQLKAVRDRCHVPLVASGGAGHEQHFADVFTQADVDAALAASVFHSKQIAIPALKSFLQKHNIAVRT